MDDFNLKEIVAKVEGLEDDVRDLKQDMRAEIHNINMKIDKLTEVFTGISDRLVSRPEMHSFDDSVSNRIELTEKQVDKLDGRMWALVVGLFLNFISTAGYFLINTIIKGR